MSPTFTNKRPCLKKYIKRFNNSYERQKDCFEENVFPDNKLYISLASASRNSSFSSSYSGCSAVNKHRRIIYPVSGGRFKVNGFLRNCDFNYEPPVAEKASDKPNSSGQVVFEKVKLNKGAASSSVDPVSRCALDDSVKTDDDDQWENFLKSRNQPQKEQSLKILTDDSLFQGERLDNFLNEEFESSNRQMKILN